MVWVDVVRFGTYFTPTALLGVPYLAISLLSFVVGPLQGYIPLYTPSVIVWVAYLALFWMTGQIATAFLPDDMLHSLAPLDEVAARPTALMVAWVAIPILVYGTWSASSTLGFEAFHESEYRRMVTWGLMGHVLMLSIPVFIYLTGTTRPRNLLLCGGTSALLLILMALRPTKSWVLLPLVAGFLCRIRITGIRLSTKSLVVTLLAMYGFFNVSYLIAFGATNSRVLTDPEMYRYLFLHAEDYLFAGVLGFSTEMQEGNAFQDNHAAVYSSIMNLKAIALGDQYVGGIEDNFILIRPGTDGFRTNVHTLFGTLVMSVGYIESAFYSIAMSIVAYAAFLASRRSRDVWVSVVWCVLGACLAFGWFSIYFAQFSTFEILGFCFLLFIVERLFRKRTTQGVRFRRGIVEI